MVQISPNPGGFRQGKMVTECPCIWPEKISHMCCLKRMILADMFQALNAMPNSIFTYFTVRILPVGPKLPISNQANESNEIHLQFLVGLQVNVPEMRETSQKEQCSKPEISSLCPVWFIRIPLSLV